MKYVYADYNATSPSPFGHSKKVFEILDRVFANPSSIHHQGREAKLLLEDSRQKIANLFGAEKNSIFFNSGATEANNIVIQGHVYDRFYKSGKKAKLILSAGEHSSVYQSADALEKRGLCEVTYIPLKASGVVDSEELLAQVSHEHTLLSLIHVNNETGAVNPIEQIIEAVRKKNPNIHIHIDAVQSFGKLDLTWYAKSEIDTASASAHKVGGFKGIGCLYNKRRVNLLPLILGGGQERGWRAGTENLPGIVSFAIRAGDLKAGQWVAACEPLRQQFIDCLLKIPGAHVHGDLDVCLATTVNFHVDGLRGEDLLLSFDAARISVSNGSACSSGGGRPSHVLKAMGYTDEIATNSVRVSFGEGSTQEDLNSILKTILDLVRSKKRSSK